LSFRLFDFVQLPGFRIGVFSADLNSRNWLYLQDVMCPGN